jgi:hypothetical protein
MKRILVVVVVAACGVDAVDPDAVPATCSNGIQDGDESDLDCGGACGICALGEQCSVDTDCLDGDAGYVATCRHESYGDALHCVEGIPATYPVTLGAPSNSSYTSGTTTWYQDYFSKKWCTSSTLATGSHGWDYTGCSWEGWKNSNDAWWYCDDGFLWEDAYTHYHCP